MDRENSSPKLINDRDQDLFASMIDTVLPFFGILPMVQLAVNAKRSITQLNEDAFNEKLYLFLTAATKDNTEDIPKFLKSLDKDADGFVKRLLKVIDRIEDTEKSIILGNLMRATAKGRIVKQHFIRLSTIVDTTYIETLKYLVKHKRGGRDFKVRTSISHTFNEVLAEKRQLTSIGLLSEKVEIVERKNPNMGTTSLEQQIDFEITNLGEAFIKYGFDGIPFVHYPFKVTFKFDLLSEITYTIEDIEGSIVAYYNEHSMEFPYTGEKNVNTLTKALSFVLDNLSEITKTTIVDKNKRLIIDHINSVILSSITVMSFRIDVNGIDSDLFNVGQIRTTSVQPKKPIYNNLPDDLE